MDYPYANPLILTDKIFTDYGGVTGSSTASQRTASYLAAEILATEAVGTFLAPTTVTGTFPWPYMGSVLTLPHHHILGIYSAVPKSPNCNSCDLLNGTACTFMQDGGQWGYLIIKDTSYLYGSCCTATPGYAPIDVQITYLADRQPFQ